MSEWTDELKQQAIDAYLAGEPSAENSMDIVETVANEMGKTANGVRAILSKAKVYIKKTSTKGPAKSAGTTSTRVNKQEAQDGLTAAIEATGSEADSDIISKLTGKAAIYLTDILKSIE